jgi:glycosyltransferase 2 family protein
MSGRLWWWLRRAAGLAILAGVLGWLGLGPVVHGVRTVDRWTLLAGVALAVPTSVCCAWRWTLVTRGLGVRLPLPDAVAAYYRSQFLNTVLPGGVVGDLHRGLRHGRSVGDRATALRAVAWERLAGQLSQMVLATVVLLAVPSPVGKAMPWVAGAVAVACLLAARLLRRVRPAGGSRTWRALVVLRSDLRDMLLVRRTWSGVALASVLAVLGHLATFLVAARTAGVDASPVRVVPLALLVLVAMALPLNVGGWGPREGVSAWAFGAAGLGAGAGLSAAVVYGVMVLVAGLPGAVVLVVQSLRGGSRA